MAQSALRMRVAGFVLIAGGTARALVGNVTREGVNDGGLAPSALVGMALIAIGAYVLYASYLVRTRQFRWLLLAGALALLVAGAVGTMLVDQAHTSEYARGLRGPFGYLVFAGYGVCYATTILTWTYVMIGAGMHVLSWMLDLIPPLRRRGVGASWRRDWRSPFTDPP